MVEVAAGHYGAQQIFAVAGHEQGADVQFRPARGADVVIDDISFGGAEDPHEGPDHIAIRDMRTSMRQAEPGAHVGSRLKVPPELAT